MGQPNLRVVLLVSSLLLGAACRSTPGLSKTEAIARGDQLVAAGNHAEAVKAYETAVKADGRDGEVRLKLSKSYKILQEWDGAFHEAIGAAELLPDNREAQLLGTFWMLRMGRWDEASASASRLLAKNPDDTIALGFRGEALARFGSSWAALVQFDEALKLRRSFEAVRVRLSKGVSRADFEEAEKALRRAKDLRAKEQYEDERPDVSLMALLWVVGRLDEGAADLKVLADASPDNSLFNRTLGLFFEMRGNKTEAERYLRIAAKSDSPSRLTLADFLVRTQRVDEAIRTLEADAAKVDEAALRIAEIEIGASRFDRALAKVEPLLKKDPKNDRALVVKANGLIAAGRNSEAVAVARDAAATKVISAPAHHALGRALVASGEFSEAFESYTKAWRLDTRDPVVAREMTRLALALGRNEVALGFAEQAVLLSPNDRAAAVVFGHALVRAGQFTKAQQTIDPFVDKPPFGPDFLVVQAGIEAGRGRTDAARATYNRALDLDPNSFNALAELADLEIRARQPARIRPRVNQALAKHRDDDRYLVLAARVALADGDLKSAESLLRPVVELSPGQEGPALALAEAFARQNRTEEAKRVLEQAVAKNQSSVDLRVALGEVFEAMGRTSDARSQYEQALTLDKESPAASARLAVIYLAQGRPGDLDLAVQLAMVAHRKKPDDPGNNDTLGWVYMKKNQPAIALPYLERAAKGQAENPVFLYHLGVAYEALAEMAKARDALTRALALKGNFPGADEARTLLKSIPK